MIVKGNPISDRELLEYIKNDNNLYGTQHDMTLQVKIATIKGYLKSAGISDNTIGSTLAIGVISRGVMDIWNYGNGDTKLSPFFYELADQLRDVEVE